MPRRHRDLQHRDQVHVGRTGGVVEIHHLTGAVGWPVHLLHRRLQLGRIIRPQLELHVRRQCLGGREPVQHQPQGVGLRERSR